MEELERAAPGSDQRRMPYIGSVSPRRSLGSLALLAITLLTAACESVQPGSDREAAAAANDFLSTLADGRAAEAWSVLTPATRWDAYNDEFDEFAVDVAAADWSKADWEIGPVVNHEISWGVYARMTDMRFTPDFLINRRLVGGTDDELQLLVQITGDDAYMIAGPGLDTRLP
jgi:hypothetical protein